MIVYQSSKQGFCRDVETGAIDDIVLARLRGARQGRDVLLSGRDDTATDRVVIVELEQWQDAEWSYAALLRGFNETVYENDVAVHPCAERPTHLPPMIDAHAAMALISPGVVT